MSVSSNMMPKILGLYDDELLLSHYGPGNQGKFIARDSLSNMHHSSTALEYHPTLSNIIRNTNGHVFVNGSFQFEWSWDAGAIAEADVDAYLNLFNSENINPHFTLQKDYTNNRIIGNLLAPNDRIDNWISMYIKWHIAAPRAKCTFMSEDSEIICVTRLNGSFSKYSFDQKTIEAGATLQVDRPTCETCYVLFTDHLYKAESTMLLMKNKMYKLTSNNITVANPSSSRIRILRYYK
jgi:hypothetical protein